MSFEKQTRTGLDAPSNPWVRILVDAGHVLRQDDVFIDRDSFHSKSEFEFAHKFRLRFTDVQSHLLLTPKVVRGRNHLAQ